MTEMVIVAAFVLIAFTFLGVLSAKAEKVVALRVRSQQQTTRKKR
jgi:hypothetical protein